MSQDILLSVIIPAYNAEKTIIKALDSVRSNNFDKRIEVIIINDGSVDRTKEICEEYIKKKNRYKKVIYKLINQQNSGHGSAINYGITNAKGKYLKVLDSDDYFDKKIFGLFLNYLSDCDSDLVCSDYREVGTKRATHKWYKKGQSFMNREYDKLIDDTSPCLLPCATVKTERLRDTKIRVDEKCYYDDQEFDFLVISSCISVSYFSHPLYCYVIGGVTQSMSETNLAKNASDHFRVIRWLMGKFYKLDLSSNKRRFIFDKILVPLCHSQYYIVVGLKKSRKDFLEFDDFLKKYKDLYKHIGVAGKRLKIHRVSRGVFIWMKI